MSSARKMIAKVRTAKKKPVSQVVGAGHAPLRDQHEPHRGEANAFLLPPVQQVDHQRYHRGDQGCEVQGIEESQGYFLQLR